MTLICLVAIAMTSLLFSPTSVSAHFFPSIASTPSGLNDITGPWDSFRNLSGFHAGDKSDGLPKLKHYLQHFGYLSNSKSNHTEDFDDSLKAAIETYQKNFNLNVSGELDPQTVHQIMRSRCGVPDIINGSTTMNAGKATPSYNGTNFHSVSHYSFVSGMPRWPNNKWDLTYAFRPENQLSNDVKSVFSLAFDRWSSVTVITFSQTESFYDSDIQTGFFVGDHGDDSPFDGLQGRLAHANPPTSGKLHVDDDEHWVVSGDVTAASSAFAVDLESVAVHEIGHLLGLGHSSEIDAIMYPSHPVRTRKVELTKDDISGIQELYGANPTYNGSSSTTPPAQNVGETSSSSAQKSGSPWSLKFNFGLGLLLLRMLL
ncbi:hypothetical protein F2P56_030200 [Juglans regia]|uniref:Peptidase metallopeptidase domain-containing protein n=2 Tax=Juglans regia TaxID=51240 RepID=A0A833U425_JUGRE|nr:metalloendoproteinase 2-MMP-like [Juglans regia]KAF5449788.1 hypothetical protein F2P56_030200 [Juglans regia]